MIILACNELPWSQCSRHFLFFCSPLTQLCILNLREWEHIFLIFALLLSGKTMSRHINSPLFQPNCNFLTIKTPHFCTCFWSQLLHLAWFWIYFHHWRFQTALRYPSITYLRSAWAVDSWILSSDFYKLNWIPCCHSHTHQLFNVKGLHLYVLNLQSYSLPGIVYTCCKPWKTNLSPSNAISFSLQSIAAQTSSSSMSLIDHNVSNFSRQDSGYHASWLWRDKHR